MHNDPKKYIWELWEYDSTQNSYSIKELSPEEALIAIDPQSLNFFYSDPVGKMISYRLMVNGEIDVSRSYLTAKLIE